MSRLSEAIKKQWENIPAQATRSNLEERCDAVYALLASMEASDVDGDECAMRELGQFLDSLNGPGFEPLLLSICDRLLALGLRDPIVASSAAQALVDMRVDSSNETPGGAMAALAVLDNYVPTGAEETPHLAAAFGMRGRAWKDVFHERLSRGAHKDAAAAAHQSLEAYRNSFEMVLRFPSERLGGRKWLWRWPMVNVLTLGRLMLNQKIAVPSGFRSPDEFGVWLNDVATKLKKLVLPDDNAIEECDAWDLATLAELEMASEGENDDALRYLKKYLARLSAEANSIEQRTDAAPPAFKLAGTLRQWTTLVRPQEEAFQTVYLAMLRLLLELPGRQIHIHQNLLKQLLDNPPSDLDTELKATLQAYFGDGHFWGVGRLRQLCIAAASVAEIWVIDENRRVATGFAVRRADVFGETGDATSDNQPVLITNAHVACWEETYRTSNKPSNLKAKFELGGSQTEFKLKGLWTVGKPPKELCWLDASVLELKGDGVDQVQTLPLLLRNDKRSGQAFVIGHANAQHMQISIGQNDVVDAPKRVKHGDKLMCYTTRTAPGSSGSPVLIANNQGAEVIALHIGAHEEAEVNVGVWLSEVVRCARA